MSTRRFGEWVELEERGDDLVLRLGSPSGAYFVFNDDSVPALEEAVSAIERTSGKRGLIVIGNARGFIAGADVHMILAVASADEASEMSRRGQRLFARLARLPVVSVAAIHGPCLGGGMELALALDWRVATRAKATKLGLPEVQLGILPGFGGTQRLPRLVGLKAALELMLEGVQLDGKRALKRGLIDRLVPEETLLDRALETVARGEPRRRLPLSQRFLTRTAIGRWIVRRKADKTLRKGTARFFPAPAKILDVTLHGLASSEDGDYDREARELGALATTSACKNLIRLFLASEKARKLHRDLGGDPAPIRSACVVGGGVMGAGIAGLLASRGVRTRLVDLSEKALAAAVARLAKSLDKRLRRRRIEPHERQAALDRLAPSTELTGFAGCDLVLEAVAEKLDLKKDIFARAAAKVAPDALLATNTSSLPLAEMAAGLPHPERLVGLHFFNPPEKMPLVEVICHDGSSDAALARAARVATDLGKFPVLVKDGPGFLVNRCLAPYLGQAVRLLEEGVAPERIDAAAAELGMPMGPLRLLDEVGWDIAASVCRIMGDAYPGRMQPSGFFDAMRDAGQLGRKSGSGIYTYDKKGNARPSARALALMTGGGHTRAQSRPPSSDDIADRLLLPLVSEAFRCLDEAVVATEEDLDLAMVMGIGFPPHLGGPAAWTRARGPGAVVARMEQLARDHGASLRPSAALAALAAGAPASRDAAAAPAQAPDAATTAAKGSPGSDE